MVDAQGSDNVLTVRELLQRYRNRSVGGEIVRFALLDAHYRQPLNWTDARLRTSKTRLERYYNVLWQFRAAETIGDIDLPAEFTAALEDDLNTPRAIFILDGMASQFYKLKVTEKKSKLKSELLACGKLLGIFRFSAEEWKEQRLEDMVADMKPGLSQEEAAARIAAMLQEEEEQGDIKRLIAERQVARSNKDFGEADRIRNELSEKGIVLEDRPDGNTDWRRDN